MSDKAPLPPEQGSGGILKRMTDIYLSYKLLRIIRNYNENMDMQIRSKFHEHHDYITHRKYVPIENRKKEYIYSYEAAEFLGNEKVWFRKIGRIRAERIFNICQKENYIKILTNEISTIVTPEGDKLLNWPKRFDLYYQEWNGAWKIAAFIAPPSVLVILIKYIPVTYRLIFK